MIPAAHSLARDLIAALDAEDAMVELYADEKVVPFALTAMRKRRRVLQADFKAALATPEEKVSKAWTWWNVGAGK